MAPFILELYPAVLPHLMQYIQWAIVKPPFVKSKDETKNNTPEVLIVPYESVGGVVLLEHVRMVFLILRNVSLLKINQKYLLKHTEFLSMLDHLLFSLYDPEIKKYILEIYASLSHSL